MEKPALNHFDPGYVRNEVVPAAQKGTGITVLTGG